MSEEIEPNAIDVELFDAIEGSQTSEDGQGFALHARRLNGSGVMLVFPHSEISNIVETAAMQMDHGHADGGTALNSAFDTSSFKIGRGPAGETIMTLVVGERSNISFLLPAEMARQLFQALGKVLVHHRSTNLPRTRHGVRGVRGRGSLGQRCRGAGIVALITMDEPSSGSSE
jgi:hypothetical protein